MRNLTEKQKNMTLGQIYEEKNKLANDIRALIKEFTERTGACVTVNGATEYQTEYNIENREDNIKLFGMVDLRLELNR